MVSALSTGSKILDVVIIYRLSSSSFALCLQELSDLPKKFTASVTPSFICGDFNIHIDTVNHNNCKFNDLYNPETYSSILHFQHIITDINYRSDSHSK